MDLFNIYLIGAQTLKGKRPYLVVLGCECWISMILGDDPRYGLGVSSEAGPF